jgi:integral membrane protein
LHTQSLRALRIVGYFEGASFLILLLIAMPLKYLADSPMAVKVVGSAHGGLWIFYLLAAVWAAVSRRWGVGKMAGAFAASVLPFGPFVFDARVLKPEEEAMKRGDNPPPSPAAGI